MNDPCTTDETFVIVANPRGCLARVCGCGPKSRPSVLRVAPTADVSCARGAVATRAVPEIAAAQELAQLAAYENEIWQTAGIVFGCTLLVRIRTWRGQAEGGHPCLAHAIAPSHCTHLSGCAFAFIIFPLPLTHVRNGADDRD